MFCRKTCYLALNWKGITSDRQTGSQAFRYFDDKSNGWGVVAKQYHKQYKDY